MKLVENKKTIKVAKEILPGGSTFNKTTFLMKAKHLFV